MATTWTIRRVDIARYQCRHPERMRLILRLRRGFRNADCMSGYRCRLYERNGRYSCFKTGCIGLISRTSATGSKTILASMSNR